MPDNNMHPFEEQNGAFARLRQAYSALEQTRPLRDLGLSTIMVNHDVKNYMAVISGYAALLLRSKTLEDKSRRMIENMLQAVIKLQDFNTRVFEISGVNQQRAAQVLDLGLIISSCVDTHFREQKPRFSLQSVSPEKSILIDGDHEKLELAFINAFNNSLEADAKNINVKIAAYNSTALIVIEDDGVGCCSRQFSNLFKTFYTTKHNAGAGLGLCIMRSVIEAHGGGVSIYSKNFPDQKQHGLSVQIVLPVNKKSAVTAVRPEIFLARKELNNTAALLKKFKNLRIIPRIVDSAENIELSTQSSSAGTLVIASNVLVPDLEREFRDNPAVKFLIVEEPYEEVLFAKGHGSNRAEHLSEDFIIRYLCNEEPPSVGGA
ncbi:MAG: HAMP domain-containing histidine kinase [Chitinispirillales bacterium]|jgi:hypothetical protein|nr:HAMP domain-containing histidine kinase [Chitinispirillales bacterium]